MVMAGGFGSFVLRVVRCLQLWRMARNRIASLQQLPDYSSFICLKMKSSVCRELHIAQCCHDGARFAKTNTAGTFDMCIRILLKLGKHELCPLK